MGLRLHPKCPSQLHSSSTPTRLSFSEPSQSRHDLINNSSNYSASSSSSSVHSKLPSMVANYSQSHLIELNRRSDDSCLVVISTKVYDLTLWLDEQPDHLLPSLHLRSIAANDPVAAGRWLADRLGPQIETRIADCRIGDFEASCPPPSFLSSSPPSPSSPSSPHLPYTQIPEQVSPNTILNQVVPVSQPSNVPQRPSHLARALALVEFHKRRVIEAETKVGSAHITLAEAFEGLAEAEKKRDHLVMLACEGCRPTLPEWEEFTHDNDDQLLLHPSSPSL